MKDKRPAPRRPSSRPKARPGSRDAAYFHHLLEQITEFITIINADGTIRYQSPSLKRPGGFTVEELEGKNAFDQIHPDDLPRVLDVFQKSLQTPGAILSLEFRFRHKDGSWRMVEANGRNLLDDPLVKGIVISSRDVTARKHLEEQFIQAQKMESIGRLAGSVAHDFRNFISAITTFAGITRDSAPQGSELRSDMEEILKAAKKATTLTSHLLALSRQQKPVAEPVNLSDQVRDMTGMLERLLTGKYVLKTDLTAGSKAVMADKGHIEQIVMNLVTNARDAMPEGGTVTIRTSMAPAAEEGDGRSSGRGVVVLTVSDTGTGMTEEVKAHLFEPFFTTKGPGKGTGLGLSTVYKLVVENKGRIEVSSESGRGTTFTIAFPCTGLNPASP